MKKNILFFILTILIFIVIIFSKEEFNKETKLLTQTWQLLELNSQDTLIINNYSIFPEGSTYYFNNDGNFEINLENKSESFIGQWEVDDSKIVIDIHDVKIEFVIEKLDNNNLWLSFELGGNKYTYQFVNSKAL